MDTKRKRKTIWEVEYLLKLLEAHVYGYKSKEDVNMWNKIKEKLIWLKSYLNSGDRWHDFGHVFFGVTLTVFFSAVTTLWWFGGIVTAVYALVKEFAMDGYRGKDTWMDLMHYAISILLAYGCIALLLFA